MNGMQMNLSMMARRRFGSLLTVLLIGATTVFLLLYPGLIEDAERELDAAYDNIDVTGWMVNAAGYDDPAIPLPTYDALLESGFIGEHYDVAYTGFTAMPAAIAEVRKYDKRCEGMDDAECAEYIKGNLLQTAIGSRSTIRGVNDIEADAALSRMAEGIEWLEGYSAEALRGDEAVCILPASSGYTPGDEAELILRKERDANTTVQDSARKVFTFKVIGIYKAGGTGAYCPLAALRGMLERESMWDFAIRSFSFTLADARRCGDFKDLLTEMGLHEDESLRAAVDDRILTGTTAPIEKNIGMLTNLQGFFYALVVLLGFFLCFLLARGRKQEYAVMRMLGESRLAVTGKAALEQVILSLLGTGLAAALLLPIKGTALPWAAAGIVAACYCAGAVAAVVFTVRVDVMTILRNDE